eukprot:scaffold86243_cov37-Phaeocystis_antarctica.AAC.1
MAAAAAAAAVEAVATAKGTPLAAGRAPGHPSVPRAAARRTEPVGGPPRPWALVYRPCRPCPG